MQIIAVDIGNSAIKLLAGENHSRVPHHSDASPTGFANGLVEFSDSIAPSITSSTEPVFWAISSVSDQQSQYLVDWIKQNRSSDRFQIITREQVPLEIIASYQSSVGVDRLIAAYAAVSLEQSTDPLIIVDAGTAVTIDVVADRSGNQKPKFEGGVIFPGAGASLSVLNSATADLPDVAISAARLQQSESIDGLVGTQTEMAIANGVCLAQAYAVAGIVDAVDKRLPRTRVWLTGGGAEHILSALPSETTKAWQQAPQLVLHGAAMIGKRLNHG